MPEHRLTMLIAALAPLALALTGCGDDRIMPVPVSGIVLIDGKPLTHGVVQVEPEAGRMSYGDIGPDGRFTLSCYEEGDGCLVGTHKVAVVAHETLSPSSQRWHAPKKYATSETSGLTVTVTEPTDNLQINLTWDGKGPFVERQGSEEYEGATP